MKISDMKDRNCSEASACLISRASYLAATFFYVGRIPVMPGTFGSLAGWGAYYLLQFVCPSRFFLFIVSVFLFFFGVLVSGRVQKESHEKDPSYIVIDEVAGIFVAFLFIEKMGFLPMLAAFILFRFFDITKIYPIRKLEELPGGWGIMADDIAAGIFSGCILLLWSFF